MGSQGAVVGVLTYTEQSNEIALLRDQLEGSSVGLSECQSLLAESRDEDREIKAKHDECKLNVSSWPAARNVYGT